MVLKSGGIILGGLELWRSKGTTPYIIEATKRIRMADGSLIAEGQYRKWAIDCAYDYLPDDVLKELFTILQSDEFLVTFMPPTSSTSITAMFSCVALPKPQVRGWDRSQEEARPVWVDIRFNIEEV